jgi:predicted dithiol-disulfide oxidoreductase (DUF899 family)
MTTELENRIADLEKTIMQQKKELAALRRELPMLVVENYALRSSSGAATTLGALFQGFPTMLLVHNMGAGCRYCSLWADGFNGFSRHLATRCGMVVSSHDSPEQQRAIAAERGWTFPMVSVAGTTLAKDLGFGDTPDEAMPGISSLQKDGAGVITRRAYTFLGPGDNYCIMWDLMDLLADQPGHAWQPR